ncbi:hypothetical protein MAPG_10666 [Magnaporthiopsis poae ATCC 64411]|uniref:Uncharacterized protein n=1 Tax=Magnaporthiopsis poae (strain ATCC 64411 / 73-15) TaxID=644358 RepID=A0A0C4ED73_MAGP6|nr:hypothetical protein MAPG_10666 [Magnaporthiopsis poae ATCC 64411]
MAGTLFSRHRVWHACLVALVRSEHGDDPRYQPPRATQHAAGRAASPPRANPLPSSPPEHDKRTTQLFAAPKTSRTRKRKDLYDTLGEEFPSSPRRRRRRDGAPSIRARNDANRGLIPRAGGGGKSTGETPRQSDQPGQQGAHPVSLAVSFVSNFMRIAFFPDLRNDQLDSGMRTTRVKQELISWKSELRSLCAHES